MGAAIDLCVATAYQVPRRPGRFVRESSDPGETSV
jgi:hypothetical protein